jgi:hypothetical protein
VPAATPFISLHDAVSPMPPLITSATLMLPLFRRFIADFRYCRRDIFIRALRRSPCHFRHAMPLIIDFHAERRVEHAISRSRQRHATAFAIFATFCSR